MAGMGAAMLAIALVAWPVQQTPRERQQAMDAAQAGESLRAGDPAAPFPKILPSAQASERTWVAEIALADPEARTFITPVAPEVFRAQGCEAVARTAAGVARADQLLNGYRLVVRCGGAIIQVHEFDYRQPLTQRVTINMVEAAVNADFGSGQALARYYQLEQGEYATAFSWYDGGQEVLFYAVGVYDPLPEQTNAALRSMMQAIVTGRVQATP